MFHDQIHIIHTEGDYEAALTEFEHYFDHEPEPGTEAADRFELLGMVLAKYEAERHPVPDASPLEVLRFMMDANGRSQSDLADLFGSRSRASEVLSGHRELSLSQIRALAQEWRIPAAALIGVMEDA
jgi:antitoxin component HigA of HigAB toxin-antitoxin module